MAIHHDKMAYGKLAPTKEELSEDEIMKMLKKLSGEDGEEEDTAETLTKPANAQRKEEE